MQIKQKFISSGLIDYNYLSTVSPSVTKNTIAASTPDLTFVGSGTNITFTETTSNSLRGLKNYTLTKDAVNRQGQQVVLPFTLDQVDLARVLKVLFDYKVASGTYADNDIGIYVAFYNVGATAWQLVTNTPINIPSNGAAPSASLESQFTTNSTAANTAYRVILHIQSTSALAYSLQFDDIRAIRYTQTASNTTVVRDLFSGNGSTTNFVLSVAPGTEDNTLIFIDGVYQQKDTYSLSSSTITFSEAPPTGTNNVEVNSGSILTLAVPADGTVTTAKLADGAVTIVKGGTNNSALSVAGGVIPYGDGTKLVGLVNGADGQFLKSNGTTVPPSWADPIASVSAKVSRNGTQSIPTAIATTVIFNTENWDENTAHDTSTGIFTVPAGMGGKYLVTAMIEFAGSATGVRSVDILTSGTGSCSLDFIFVSSASGNMLGGSAPVNVVAGDTIKIQVYQNTGGNLNIGTSGVTYSHASFTRIGS